ncbi:TIR domain-containing protein [Lactiplantibacillus pentosus]|uniref:TIR domain-containing protein n=1 Tax=Lactiplantibacillus pentosus TaxID=1589 RepID=UPI001C1F9D04|nr:TIR domain-containing protein [Lactiplantibacillus pentosus]MBU7503421.1 TIR domain-containing protein [Lactiplantibacillus pentosus]MCG0633053.1 hypothetical protein [Lactiplantibacillus plantarum]MDY1544149.1 TIR domain-containing protein [Lactiplantibacillus pentosus]
MTNNVFVSFHHDTEDTYYKNLLVAWSKNDNGYFNINFYDRSVGVSINSSDANYIKRVIKGRIDESPKFLCLIGKNTAKSDWVAWEIKEAAFQGKKIVAVKIKDSYASPSEIYGVGASWAHSFNYAAIKKALDY